MSTRNIKRESSGPAPHAPGSLASFEHLVHAGVGMLRRVLERLGLAGPKLQLARQPVSRPAAPRRSARVRRGDRRRGFTLVELLVVVTVVGLLAGATMAALGKARETAKRSKTETTIAKLNDVIMRRYETYKTRRVPVNPQMALDRSDANRFRLDALRDLMRMELPERFNDILKDPVVDGLERPALSALYLAIFNQKRPDDKFGPAECLYLIVNCGSAEDRARFHRNEIDDVDKDGWPEFIDGWGRPIYFLRWAPGFVESEIQSGDANLDHDPFDVYGLDPGAYQLYPLIYSAGGGSKEPSLELSPSHSYDGDPYNVSIGSPAGEGNTHIHNHHRSLR